MPNIYEAGKGKIVVRGSYIIENDRRKNRIVFTEIPYGTNKASIVESIFKISSISRFHSSNISGNNCSSLSISYSIYTSWNSAKFYIS
jgi:DNA gyrase/topoisomerase IV subunit A